MINYLVKISYIGKNYCGWQVQKNGTSVCAVVQKAVETAIRHKTDIVGCGRTDACVNAYGYCFNFKTDEKLNESKFLISLNALLPEDISAISVKEVPEDFHARYNAKGKSYIYKIWNKPYINPFLFGLCYNYSKPLDVEKMRKASEYLVGKQDFYPFMAAGSTVSDTVRTIYKFDITEDNGLITVKVIGSGFLYKMVRSLVGFLFTVGKGDVIPEYAPEILESKDRSKIGFTMPPEGLYFNEIYYSDAELERAVKGDGND